MRIPKYPKNFVYPEIKDSDRLFGVALGPVLRPDGDWRKFLPPDEDQRQNGVESSSCYVEAQQKGIADMQEALFNLKDQNYSARFNALLSGGTPNGGDPIRGAMSIKKDGLIPEEVMPFKGINTWEEFHSWKGVDINVCKQKGEEFKDRWNLNYKIVAEREDPIETKYSELREALKRGPVAISVFAWRERNGMYYKPVGKRDTHLTLAVYLDEQNRIHVRDSYVPYEKILEPKTNFEFAITWSVEKKPYEQEINILIEWLKTLAVWAGLIAKEKASVIAPQPQPEPSKREKLLEEARRWLGKEASPQDIAPDDLGCAESVCNVIAGVFPDFPIITATWKLFDHLKQDKRFEIVDEIKPGNIILSPTGFGNNTIRGHVGIYTKEGVIASNDSTTGLWEENFTTDSWIARYRTKGGMPVVIFEAK